MTSIAHILGGWSVNIGNAFFQLAGYEVLRELFPSARISLVPEQPGYPSYWNRRGGNPAHSASSRASSSIGMPSGYSRPASAAG